MTHDEPSHLAMQTHRNFAFATAAAFWWLGFWSVRNFFKGRKLKGSFIIALTLAALLLMITGWRGGELVYRYGLGVASLPETHEKGREPSQDHEH